MSFKPLLKALIASTALGFVLASAAQAAEVAGQGTWESTLLGRDIGLNAVAATSADAVYLYDTTLNVTWLRNANANGDMNWGIAVGWADNLVTGGGSTAISDWRLPMMSVAASCNWSDTGGTNCGLNAATGSSELASLYFGTLGNASASFDIDGNRLSGAGLTNTGSFVNLISGNYWMGTADTDFPADAAWSLNTEDGVQSRAPQFQPFSAMAVRSGDVLVTAVPEPETYALMLAGLALMAGVARRRRDSQA